GWGVIARFSISMATVHSDVAGNISLSTLDNRFAVHPPRIVHIAHWDGDALVLVASVRNITRRQKPINTPLIRHRDSTKRRQILWLVEPLSRGHVRDSDRVRRSNQRLELIKNVHHGLRITHVWLRRPLHNVTERSTRDISKLLASDLRNVLIGL